MLAQRVGVADAVDADDEAEAAGPAGLDAGERVLEDRGLGRLDAERPGAGEEGVRRGLALQVLALGDDAVDPRLEEVLDSGRGEHVAAVGAGGDDGAAQSRVARRLEVADRSLVGFDAVLSDHLQDELVLAVAEPADGLGARAGRRGRPRAARSPARRGTTRTPS